MGVPVDTSGFPVGGPDISYDDPEDEAAFEALQGEALTHVQSFGSPPPVESLTLAFGVAPLLALYLVRFRTPIARGELAGETELWAVVGELPRMVFETNDAPTPALALQLYCAIAQDWAENVLAGADLSQSYPIAVEPTPGHTKMLLVRIAFLRQEWVPRA